MKQRTNGPFPDKQGQFVFTKRLKKEGRRHAWTREGEYAGHSLSGIFVVRSSVGSLEPKMSGTGRREERRTGAVFILARTKGVKVGPAIIQVGKHLAKTETNL